MAKRWVLMGARENGPGNGGFQGGGKFIHAQNDQNLVGTKTQGGYPVAVVVHVKQLAVFGGGVAAHNVGVAEQGLAHQLPFFRRIFGGIPVNHLVVGLYVVKQADLGGRNGAAQKHPWLELENGLDRGFFLGGQ